MSESVKAAEEKIASHHSTDHLDSIKGFFDRMEQSGSDGRTVTQM